MGAAIPLRADFTGDDLRRLAKASRDAGQMRRLLALATICDGGSRSHAAKLGGVTLQIVRDWVVRFNAEGPDGLSNRKAPGKAPLLSTQRRAALARAVEAGPRPYLDGVVRWRLVDLVAWVQAEFGVSASRQTLGRELRAMGFRKLSVRPQAYRQDPEAMDVFKKNFPALVEEIRSRVRRPIEVWFQDEARIGQKNKLTRRWARRGTRPRAVHDQRTKWAYIFGAICPKRGVGAGLVMPYADTPAMQAHLAEISAAVAPGAHAVLVLDQAGWHISGKLKAPDNITLVPLPPRSPELNPVENVWQFMRENWLSNRVFTSYEDIVDHCCQAWNDLIDQPWRIMSIGTRDWPHGF
ncbi:MAG: IS630 family transposase [Pseudomonadota bacterium]